METRLPFLVVPLFCLRSFFFRTLSRCSRLQLFLSLSSLRLKNPALHTPAPLSVTLPSLILPDFPHYLPPPFHLHSLLFSTQFCIHTTSGLSLNELSGGGKSEHQKILCILHLFFISIASFSGGFVAPGLFDPMCTTKQGKERDYSQPLAGANTREQMTYLSLLFGTSEDS